MDNQNLPSQRATFGIGRTLGQAWTNALHATSKFGGGFKGQTPVNQDPNTVSMALDNAHASLHANMAQQALNLLRTGKTVMPARLTPDPRYDNPPLDNSGMTRVGQHTAPIYGKGDYSRPAANAVTFNPWERDKGSITYMAEPGKGVHSAVPER